MVRSAGSNSLVAGIEEVKRAPSNKKGKGKMQYPARITAAAVENPNPVCFRDFKATDDAGLEDEAHKVNQQGMFRKMRNLTNGTLSNTQYEGFFTIYHGEQPEGEKEWYTATGNEHPSEISFAMLEKKFTILKNWRTDDEPHPPFWWTPAKGPVLDVVGCAQS